MKVKECYRLRLFQATLIHVIHHLLDPRNHTHFVARQFLLQVVYSWIRPIITHAEYDKSTVTPMCSRGGTMTSSFPLPSLYRLGPTSWDHMQLCLSWARDRQREKWSGQRKICPCLAACGYQNRKHRHTSKEPCSDHRATFMPHQDINLRPPARSCILPDLLKLVIPTLTMSSFTPK